MALKGFLVFLFVAIMAMSAAEAQSALGTVRLNGTLYCSTNGSGDSNTPVFPNASMMVGCRVSAIANAPTGSTNSEGVYLLELVPQFGATADSLASDCRVFVFTPLSSCNPALPPSGLIGRLRFVRTVSVGAETVTYLTAENFSRL